MRRLLPILFAVLLLAIPSGYAIAYQGSASCLCESADGSCIIVESCVYDNGEYVPSQIITEQAGVTKTGNTYSLSANNVQISPDNLYLNIYGVGYDGSVTVSCAFDRSCVWISESTIRYFSFGRRCIAGRRSSNLFPDSGKNTLRLR